MPAGDREQLRDTRRPDPPPDQRGGEGVGGERPGREPPGAEPPGAEPPGATPLGEERPGGEPPGATRPGRERPEAVLLDAGGVFLQPDARRLLDLVHRFGSTVRTAEELDRAHYSAANEADTGDDVRYRAVWARHLGVPEAMRDQLFDALRSQVDGWWWVRPVPSAVAALRDIVASGVRTAIVSNADGFVEDLLRTAEVCQEGPGPLTPVDVIVDSTVVGVAKPDPRIFQIALERLGGVPPERAVHVGDTAFADVRGARAAGVEPVHLDPYGDCRYPAGDHRHVRSLAEVVKMFL